MSSASDYVMFGLSHGDTDGGYADIDYAIYTYPATGQLMVFEGGAYRTTLGSYAVNDVLRVGVEGGVVTYSVNGVLLYSSSTPPTYPLVTDTSLYSANATVTAARMGGELEEIVSWTHLNGVEVDGRRADASGGGRLDGGSDLEPADRRREAAARSTRVADLASYVMFGLSHGDTDGSYADIDYALYTYPPTSQVMVFEGGSVPGPVRGVRPGRPAAGERRGRGGVVLEERGPAVHLAHRAHLPAGPGREPLHGADRGGASVREPVERAGDRGERDAGRTW